MYIDACKNQYKIIERPNQCEQKKNTYRKLRITYSWLNLKI